MSKQDPAENEALLISTFEQFIKHEQHKLKNLPV